MKNFIGLISMVFIGLMTTLAQIQRPGGLLRNQFGRTYDLPSRILIMLLFNDSF